MTGKFYRGVLILAALGAFVSVPMLLNAQPSSAGNVREAIQHAKEAVAMANRVMLRSS